MPDSRQQAVRLRLRRLSRQASTGNRNEGQSGQGDQGGESSAGNGNGSGSGRDRSRSGRGRRTNVEERLLSSSSINIGPVQASNRLKQDPDQDARDPDGTSDDEPEVRLVILNAVQNFFDLLDTTERPAPDTPGRDRGGSRELPGSPTSRSISRSISRSTPARSGSESRTQTTPEAFLDAKRRLLSLLRSKMLNMSSAQKADLRAWVFHRYVMGHFDSITDKRQLRTLLQRQMEVLKAIATETRPRTRDPAVPWFLDGYRAFLTDWQNRVPEMLQMEERRRQEIDDVIARARTERSEAPDRLPVSLLWRT